jgi:hypothetical protein
VAACLLAARSSGSEHGQSAYQNKKHQKPQHLFDAPWGALQVMQGMNMGNLVLQATGDATVDACFQLVSNPSNTKPVFSNFASLRFTKRAASVVSAAAVQAKNAEGADQASSAVQPVPAVQSAAAVQAVQPAVQPDVQAVQPAVQSALQPEHSTVQLAVQPAVQATRMRLAAAAAAQPTLGPATTAHYIKTLTSTPTHNQAAAPAAASGARSIPTATPAAATAVPTATGSKTTAVPTATPAAGLDLSARQYNWLTQGLMRLGSARLAKTAGNKSTDPGSAAAAAAAAAAWEQLRLNSALPQGQDVLESLGSPYDTEDLSSCPDCQPLV